MRFKTVFLVTGLILVLLPVIATAIIRLSDIELLLTNYVEKQTGREFSVSSIGIGWSLRPSIYVDNPRLGNASWAKEIDAFSANRIHAKFSILSLLRGEIEIVDIDVISPLLIIENHPDTKISNFSFDSSSSKSNVANLEVNQLSVVNGRIEVIKEFKTWGIEVDNLELYADSANHPIQGLVTGSIEGTPISLSGSLGRLSELLSDQESAIEVRGSVSEFTNHVSISGVIGNLSKWTGLNLWVEAEVQDLSSLSGLLNGSVPEGLPITDLRAKWELVQPDKTDTLRIESLAVNATIFGLESSAHGSIGALTRLSEIDLQFHAQGTPSLENSLESIIDFKMLDANISGSLKGAYKKLILNLNESSLTAPGITLGAEGLVENLMGEWSHSVPLNLYVEDLSVFRQIESGQWSDFYPFEVTGDLLVRDKEIDLENMVGRLDGNAIDISAKGSISNLIKSPVGSILLTGAVNAKNLSFELSDRVSSLLGNTSFHSRIDVDDKEFSMSGIEISVAASGVSAMASGAIEDLRLMSGVAIRLEGKLDGLQVLNSTLSSPFPITNAIDLSAILENQQDGGLKLSNILFSSLDAEADMRVAGEIRDIGPQQSIHMNLFGEVFKTEFGNSFLPKDAQYKLPMSLFPLSFKSTLVGNMVDGSFDNLSVQDILVSTQGNNSVGQVKGYLENLHLEQISGDLEIYYKDEIEESSEQLQSLLGQYPLVLKGKLIADLKLKILQGKVSIPKVDMSIVDQNSSVKASGGIDQLSPLISNSLTITMESDELGHVISANSFGINSDIPVAGTLVLGNQDSIPSFDLSLRLADSNLIGQFDIAASLAAADMSTIKGNVTSTYLDLTKILKKGPEKERVFSQEKINLDWLDSISGEVDFDLDHVKTDKVNVKDLSAKLVLDPGKISINARSEADQEKGQLDLNLTMGKVGKEVTAFLTIDGEDSDMTMFNNANTEGNSDNGSFDTKIQIEGQGDTISKIMAASNGELLFTFSGAKIKSQGLELFSDDFLHGILSFINPLVKKQEFIDVECAVVRLNVVNGLASSNQGMAMKTENFTVLGSGEIDLKEESLKLLFSSKARKGLGINTNTVAKMINVGGTLKNVKVESNAGGLLQTGAAVGAAILSGGISLLAQGLYDKIKANSNVCGLALSPQASQSTTTIDK